MRNPSRWLLLLSYLAFVSLGLPDTVLGVAWPSLRVRFELPQAAMGAVLVTGVSGYFASGLIAGNLIARLGVGVLLASSSGLVALALIGYSLAPSWYAFFPVAALMGLGSGAIDSALNGYAARHFSARHMNWLHACWGVGASTGPLIMTTAIARGYGYTSGYAALAALVAALALAFVLTRRAWGEPSDRAAHEPATTTAPRGSLRGALGNGKAWLLIGCFFVYTGLETSIGQWCFTLLTEARGLPVEGAGLWTAAFWASLTLGRVALGFIVERFGADRLLRYASAGIILGAGSFALSSGLWGRLALLLLGFSLAPVYPTLMARTPVHVGERDANHTVGLLVSAATLGSTSMPALVGVLVGRFGLGAIGSVALGLGVGFLVLHEVLQRSAGAARAPALP